jgi:hypothetical protein
MALVVLICLGWKVVALGGIDIDFGEETKPVYTVISGWQI